MPSVYLAFMYSTGEGVLKDFVLVHMWFNSAGANGHEGARDQRDDLERDVTGAQIIRATDLARVHGLRLPGLRAVKMTAIKEARWIDVTEVLTQ